MQYLTNNHLFSVTFSQGKIVKVIQNLGSSKTHGHDDITIRMAKIFFKPLAIILHCVNTCVFSSEWKKGDIVKKVTNVEKLPSSIVRPYF